MFRIPGRRKGSVFRDPGFPEIAGMSYINTLVDIIRAVDANWYLEVGSRTGTSLSHVPCNFVAIDPVFQLDNARFQSARQMHFFQMTSDIFFETGFLSQNGIKPDVAFIDGMHHFEFALRDFINVEKNMDPEGVIVFHDVCPSNHAMATREMHELEAKRPWTGDVWKVIVALLEHRSDLEVHIVDSFKTGLGVVRGLDPTNSTLRDNLDAIVAQYIDINLESFGVERYFGSFELEPAAGFAARTFGAPGHA